MPIFFCPCINSFRNHVRVMEIWKRRLDIAVRKMTPHPPGLDHLFPANQISGLVTSFTTKTMKTTYTLDFQMHHREQLLNKYSFIALIRPQNIIMAAAIQRSVAASPSRCFSFIFWGFCCARAPHPEPCAVCMHGCAWAPVSQGTPAKRSQRGCCST